MTQTQVDGRVNKNRRTNMCKYCERQKDIQVGWNQPALYADVKPSEFGNKLTTNLGDDWEARIYDYQTSAPSLTITSKNMANHLWGDGIAAIYLPSNYCNICGRKLGTNTNTEAKRYFVEGTIVSHFKRHYCDNIEKQANMHLYKIMGVATNSETNEPMTVYQALYPPYQAFVKPSSLFYAKVNKTKYFNSIQKYKIELYTGEITDKSTLSNMLNHKKTEKEST